MKKTSRQGLLISIKELRDLTNELEKEQIDLQNKLGVWETKDYNLNQHFLISIINKTPKQCDKWEIEK